MFSQPRAAGGGCRGAAAVGAAAVSPVGAGAASAHRGRWRRVSPVSGPCGRPSPSGTPLQLGCLTPPSHPSSRKASALPVLLSFLSESSQFPLIVTPLLLSVCKPFEDTHPGPYVLLQTPRLRALAAQRVRALTSLPSSTTDLLPPARSWLCRQHAGLLLRTGLAGADLRPRTHSSVPVTSRWVFPGSGRTRRWLRGSPALSLKSCSLCRVGGPVSHCQKTGRA